MTRLSLTQLLLWACAMLAWLGAAALESRAHEFWIDPKSGRVAVGDDISADLRVGTMMQGERYPYLSDRVVLFAVVAGDKARLVEGFEGDLPALAQIEARPGLNIVLHETAPFLTTHDSIEEFELYLSEEGIGAGAATHRARGLPDSGFDERYYRYAKALVQAGAVTDGQGDRAFGMPLELVAEANPYDPGRETLPVRLLWRGKPRADWQISTYRRDGAVERRNLRTDEHGRVTLPLEPGAYLLNAVNIEPLEDDPAAVWVSHWASLSFELGNPRSYLSE